MPAEPLTIVLPEVVIEQIAERAAELVLEQLAARNLSSEAPWLTLEEAAGYLRVSERTIERLIARGRLRSTTVGRRRLVHRDDLDKAATGEETAPTAPPRRRGG